MTRCVFCIIFSKISNEPWKLKGVTSRKPLRRPSSAKKLPLLTADIILQAARVASLKQVCTKFTTVNYFKNKMSAAVVTGALRGWYRSPPPPPTNPISTRETKFMIFFFFFFFCYSLFCTSKLSKKGSTLKGKNLVQGGG